jgi:formylglycine-generating enzyme required for sulfatase activity
VLTSVRCCSTGDRAPINGTRASWVRAKLPSACAGVAGRGGPDLRSFHSSAFLLMLVASRAVAQVCFGDLNGDREVGGADLSVILDSWGQCDQCLADLDGNGSVNGADLGSVLIHWGPCPVVTPSWATLVESVPDPSVVPSPTLRAAIVGTGLAWRVQDSRTGIEMLLVPPGTYLRGCIMGSPQWPCRQSELPVHEVTLTRAFYLGRFEVTQSQWQATMGSNPSEFQEPSAEVPEDQVPFRPVEQVSWSAIQAFLSATGCRLPTEAEWEFACRAGTQTPFYNDSSDDSTVGQLAWYSANSNSQTHPVGGKAANGLGFHDMLGNVIERVSDWYSTYSSTPQTNPTGPFFGLYRVVRGGSWSSPGNSTRASFRYDYASIDPFLLVGFRVARNP